VQGSISITIGATGKVGSSGSLLIISGNNKQNNRFIQ